MSMLMTIFVALAVVAVALIIVVVLSPADFRVSRARTIAAPVDTVFNQVNDLRNWEAWSPWQKLDPAMKQTYSGPPAGSGATMAWIGNSKVGEGRMTITDSRPNQLVAFRLEFLKPFKATNAAEFTFKRESGGTNVTWTMSGKKNFISKVMCLFFNMDRMVGGQFAQGLEQLSAIVAKTPVSSR